MNELVKINENNQTTTDSRTLALVFGKKHSHILRDIQTLEIPRDFRESNFGLSSFHSGTRYYPMYEITFDGFTLLAMGFTGKKAMEFKVKYIKAFRAMEAKLKNIYACGEVAVKEHTRSLPVCRKKEIVLSEKAKEEIGGIVKVCVAAELKRLFTLPEQAPAAFGEWAATAQHAIGAMNSEYLALKDKQAKAVKLLGKE